MKALKILGCSVALFLAPYAWADNPKDSAIIKEPTSYVACGCGCCGGVKPREAEKCLDKAKGESLSKIIDEDRRFLKEYAQHCALAGCSMGVEHHYCN